MASNDLVVLDHGHIFIIHLLFEPFVSAVHITLMGLLIGVNILWGLLVMLVFIVLQFFIAKCITGIKTKTNALSDKRLKLLRDIFSDISTIKTQCWQDYLSKKVAALRKKEAVHQVNLNFIKTNVFSMLRFSGYIGAAIVFYSQTLRGEILQAGTSFSVLATLNFLAFYVCLFMGYGITSLSELLTILDRAEGVLLQ